MHMNKNAFFPLGRVLCTRGALLKLMRFGVDGGQLLQRHVVGDFGDLCDEDRTTNLMAIAEGGRVFSSYEYEQVRGPRG